MIDDLDDALRAFLIRELPVKNGEIEITFDQPKKDWSARLSRPTLNLFLYDIRENQRLRREQAYHEIERRPDGVVQRRQPYRIDLHYLVTAWAAAPEDEHRMLGRALMALLRYQELPGDVLPEALSDQPMPILLKTAQTESMEKPNDFWSVMDNQQRPGISVVVTVAFNPYAPIVTPMTRTAEFQLAHAQEPKEALRFFSIRGTVRSRQQQPLTDLRVTVLERGIRAAVRPGGEFGIPNLQPGRYTLEVSAEGHTTRQHTITVPAESYDLEL